MIIVPVPVKFYILMKVLLTLTSNFDLQITRHRTNSPHDQIATNLTNTPHS